VSLKELFVVRDVLDPDDTLARLDLEDPIDEQERIPVREDLQDLADSDLQGGPPFSISASLRSISSSRRASSGRRAIRAERRRNSRWGAAGIPETTAPGATDPVTPAWPVAIAPLPTVT
jgi:hypothetical protein